MKTNGMINITMEDTNQLIELLKRHKSALTTVQSWNIYAEKKGLPSASSLIYRFGSWNKMKKLLGLPVRKRYYTIAELEAIAKKYKSYFRTRETWNSFSQKQELPKASTYIKAFGSWNEAKRIVGIQNQTKKRNMYSKERIRTILMTHGRNYQNRKQWDEYAKQHKLPTYKTIRKYLTYQELSRLINKKASHSKDELITIAENHKKVILNASTRQWDEYAKEKGLPSSFIYIKKFGSWKNIKNEIENDD